MTIYVVKLKNRCKRHRVDGVNYLGTIEIAEKRRKKGEKQKQCPDCKRWFFEDEF